MANHFSRNPNLTFENIRDNIDKPWDYWSFSSDRHNNFSCPINRIQENAARVIQRNCLRWLNEPVTLDGKLGITLRLGLKELGSLSEAPLYPVQQDTTQETPLFPEK